MIDKILKKDYTAVIDLKLKVLEKIGTINYSVNDR